MRVRSFGGRLMCKPADLFSVCFIFPFYLMESHLLLVLVLAYGGLPVGESRRPPNLIVLAQLVTRPSEQEKAH